jgi:hypothetical protein
VLHIYIYDISHLRVNAYYNNIINAQYNYISNKGLLEECTKEETVAVTEDCHCFLFENNTVKHFVQCPVFAPVTARPAPQ